jgi:hypothetical protein
LPYYHLAGEMLREGSAHPRGLGTALKPGSASQALALR